MTELWDNVKRRSRSFSISGFTKPISSVPIRNQLKMDQGIRLQLGETSLLFREGKWITESEKNEMLIRELEERNRMLMNENELLGFKLGLVLDMLALSKLDLVQMVLANDNKSIDPKSIHNK
ncbi:hypothetical protein BC833DRAFT_661382 [Globomyces pollinis-pini]|nr:hypothetical protein BC833DRAFT_661382 [Globomyces pollinis-pini]